MPSFTSRHYTPDRFRSFTKSDDMDTTTPTGDMMEDIIHHNSPKPPTTSPLTLVPSDGSLLDYFDLPSPPSTPHRPSHTHNGLSFSSLNSFPSPTTSPGLMRSASTSLSGSRASSRTSSPSASPQTPHWPTASQRLHHARLPTRPRSRSVSSTSSSSSSGSGTLLGDVEMTGTSTATSAGPAPYIRATRRTPYYPPNSSRNIDRARVYMNRGPHYIPNWTPMSSLPRHVQLQIEERMVRFTAI